MIGVDGYEEEARVGIDETSLISLAETMRYSSFTEKGQVCDVLAQFESRRVLLGDVERGNCSLLEGRECVGRWGQPSVASYKRPASTH